MKCLSCKIKFNMRPHNKEKGFTYIELMIALTISVIVVNAIYSSYKAVFKAWQKIEIERQLYQDIRISLYNIVSELRACFSPPIDFSDTAKPYLPEVEFIGIDDKYEEKDVDRLIFISTLKIPDPNSPVKEYDLHRISYFINKNNTSKNQQEGILASSIVELNFRYYDGKSWQDSWKRKENLPKAVEIKITAKNEGLNAEVSLSTTVWLPTSNRPEIF